MVWIAALNSNGGIVIWICKANDFQSRRDPNLVAVPRSHGDMTAEELLVWFRGWVSCFSRPFCVCVCVWVLSLTSEEGGCFMRETQMASLSDRLSVVHRRKGIPTNRRDRRTSTQIIRAYGTQRDRRGHRDETHCRERKIERGWGEIH